MRSSRCSNWRSRARERLPTADSARPRSRANASPRGLVRPRVRIMASSTIGDNCLRKHKCPGCNYLPVTNTMRNKPGNCGPLVCGWFSDNRLSHRASQPYRHDVGESLASWVLRQRKRRGLSQKAVGNALGCSQQAVQSWEQGRNASPANLRRLAELFGEDPPAVLNARPVEHAHGETRESRQGSFRSEVLTPRLGMGVPLSDAEAELLRFLALAVYDLEPS
jgi:transcriptional regulator with XRE-family HTH domain